jgi:hypothetical protein
VEFRGLYEGVAYEHQSVSNLGFCICVIRGSGPNKSTNDEAGAVTDTRDKTARYGADAGYKTCGSRSD